MARKSQAEKIAEWRIQRAVGGFQIPMMSIVALHKALQQAIAAGQSDDELKTLIGAFPNVIKS
jgi:hypothetical protein